jgi:hypothetical protein
MMWLLPTLPVVLSAAAVGMHRRAVRLHGPLLSPRHRHNHSLSPHPAASRSHR